jgi:hypothetical protein
VKQEANLLDFGSTNTQQQPSLTNGGPRRFSNPNQLNRSIRVLMISHVFVSIILGDSRLIHFDEGFNHPQQPMLLYGQPPQQPNALYGYNNPMLFMDNHFNNPMHFFGQY